MTPELPHILSLGAGVQSSTLALMAAAGEVTPMPTCAIFADTQAEPPAVYSYLDWLEKQLPFPVYRVTAGNLTEFQLTFTKAAQGEDYIRNVIPAFMRNPDGSQGMLLRKCTGDFKLAPIRRKTREIYEETGRVGIIQWIGISRDEMIRMKDSGVQYITNRYPLVDLRMTRDRCIKWLEAHSYPVPVKSACFYCPYHGNQYWNELKTTDPVLFERAAQFEDDWNMQVKRDMRATQIRVRICLHRSLVPLRQIDFAGLAKNEQEIMADRQRQYDFGFMNECDGLCGV